MAGQGANINFKVNMEVNGKQQVVDLGVSVSDLNRITQESTKSMQEFASKKFGTAAFVTTVQGCMSAIYTLNSYLGGLAEGYQAGQQEMTKLATTMRNTMDATDSQVKSVSNLCAAQRDLGVVGKAALLQGSQELATYLTLSDSLEKLIPVMGDMAAQQNGIGASGEQVMTIATMLGKVMNGQVGALSRYGYTFTDAQERILKFGTETEKVATLVDVVSQSVGGVNEALGNTTEGTIFHLKQQINGVKASIGAMVQSFLPFLSTATQIGTLATSVITVSKSIGLTTAAVKAYHVVVAALKPVQEALKVAIFGTNTALNGTTVAATGAKVAIRGLLVATGVGIAIAALTEAISWLWEWLEKASDGSKELSQTQQDLQQIHDDTRRKIAETTVEIGTECQELRQLIDSNGDASSAIAKLNDKYKGIFGTHETAAEWYDTLTSKSEAYSRAMAYEAATQQIRIKVAEHNIKAMEMNAKMAALTAQGKGRKEVLMDSTNGKVVKTYYASEEARLLSEEMAKMNEDAKALTSQLRIAKQAWNDANAEFKKGFDTEQAGVSIASLKEKIKNLNAKIEIETDSQKRIKMQNDLAKLNAQLHAIDGSKTTAKVEVKTEYLAQSGSAADLQQKSSDLQKRISIEVDPDKKQQLMAELVNIETQLATITNNDYFIRFRVENPDFTRVSADVAALPSKVWNLTDSFKTLTSGSLELNNQLRSIVDVSPIVKKLNSASTSIKAAATKMSTAMDIGGALSSVMQDMSNVVSGSASSWLQWGASVVNACAKALPAIMAVTAAKAAESAAETPVVGWILAGAAIASVIAAFASIPKFANGGIAYGPTVGLFGEYAGAANNPEVVAPLDKLRDLITPQSAGAAELKFKIEGRDLVAIYNKVNHVSSRR